MAKHGRRRRKFRRYLKGQINHSQGLSTLGPLALISSDGAPNLIEKAWLSSVKATWSIADWTPNVDDGPIMIGLCHSDYVAAEIEAWIENLASWDSSDTIGQEISKRMIRRVGVFRTPTGTGLATVLNDGRPITTKCNWMLQTGETIKVWYYNMGASALTTGSTVFTEGHANLWPA